VEILTIGHSTRSLDDFLSLLQANEVRVLVDVRRYPASRRHPHFARDSLEHSVRVAGIEYAWLPGLGGRRHRKKDSPHTSWLVEAFAGYADHMESREFLDAARELLEHSQQARTVIMCAEALPQRCHRRLISDWLLTQGIAILHVLAANRAEHHQLTPFARVDGERIVYDGGNGQQLELLRR
jgi:uncharacterized protein (DUF488 family)